MGDGDGKYTATVHDTDGRRELFPQRHITSKRVAASTKRSRKSRKRKRDDKDRSGIPTSKFNDNFIQDAMPIEYVIRGLDHVALLNDGKDFVTDTIRINSCVSRGQYSDKMKTRRYILTKRYQKLATRRTQ